MAKLTMVFGAILVLLGVGVYLSVGERAPTSLIPAVFGILFVIAGAAANTEVVKRRKLWMHIAATAGLIGFVFPFVRSLPRLIEAARGQQILRPLAVEEQMAMAIICLVYTVLCVRWFVARRRDRLVSA